MSFFDEEIFNLFASLYTEKVDYILIEGFAVNLHGYSRTTADIDIWIRDTKENRIKLRKALNSVGLGDMKQVETMQFVPGWNSFKMNSGFELDVMTDIKGFTTENFDECFNAAPVAEVYAIPIKFLHIQDLIKGKKASGRSKDKIDLLELKRILKEREND